MRDRNPVASNRVIDRVIGRPEVNSSQNAGIPTPPGAVTPMPVITTRLVTPHHLVRCP
jgi:hypothetical protein